MAEVRRKIDLYILSLALLFIFFIIITLEIPVCFSDTCEFVGFVELVTPNVVPIASCIALLYCLIAYSRFTFDLKGATDIPFEIKAIKGINYEHLTFLATYVVPLISFDFGSLRQMAVLGLLLIVMGIIYIKTDLFYANPSLALLGYHIYEVSGEFKTGRRNSIVLISRQRLYAGMKVEYIKLDERIYYVKGRNNG